MNSVRVVKPDLLIFPVDCFRGSQQNRADSTENPHISLLPPYPMLSLTTYQQPPTPSPGQSGTFATINESNGHIVRDAVRVRNYIRVHSWCCVFYGLDKCVLTRVCTVIAWYRILSLPSKSSPLAQSSIPPC